MQGRAQDVSPGSLYVVATPLGNLGDCTARARDVLGRVDRIYAEDTRVTATLLAHLGINVRTTALNAHNEMKRAAEVIGALAAGESVALVTDAGTPAVSDPGARVVRAAHEAGHPVVPIPGASAAIAAVSAAGLVAERFLFAGFLPQQAKARRNLLERFATLPVALVLYEAPHRIRETVAALVEALGKQRTLVIARELTKRFEEIARMPMADAPAWLEAHAHRCRGEFVLVIDQPESGDAPTTISDEVERWLAALVDTLPAASAARIAATASGVPRDVLYARASELKRGRT